VVPPEVGYASNPEAQPRMPSFATKRQLENHAKEALMFEVQLVRVVG
jgi:hypothetical protein